MAVRKRKVKRKRIILRKLHEVQTYDDEIGGFITYSMDKSGDIALKHAKELRNDGFRVRIIPR